MELSARTSRISVSPTMKVAADAMKLKAQGVDIVDFGAGEPDFPTPPHVSAAAHRAIDANFTKYTTNSGTVNSGDFSMFMRIPTTIRSNRREPRWMMSTCPLVSGSKEPG